jgi:exportin-1
LLEPLLLDYQRNIPAARNAEVLSVMTACVTKLKDDACPHVPKIMEGVFRCTLEMLMTSYVEHPEHRLNFFKLLESLIINCFAALFAMDGDTVKLVVDSLIWGFKHPQRDVAETVCATPFEPQSAFRRWSSRASMLPRRSAC